MINMFVRLLTVAVTQNLLIDVVRKWVSTIQTAAQCMCPLGRKAPRVMIKTVEA